MARGFLLTTKATTPRAKGNLRPILVCQQLSIPSLQRGPELQGPGCYCRIDFGQFKGMNSSLVPTYLHQPHQVPPVDSAQHRSLKEEFTERKHARAAGQSQPPCTVEMGSAGGTGLWGLGRGCEHCGT